MGFREDVPLDGFINLTPFASEVLLGQPDDGVRFGGAPSSFVFTLPESDDQPMYLTPLRSGGHGPIVRSTSLELESWPSVVWDVNGYYHVLGVGFRATRKQLLTAYIQLNGQNDEYLTYVFKQLLDPSIRRNYDSAPFGSKFLDKYVEADLKRMAQRWAVQMSMEPEDVLREWGFEVEPPRFEEPDEVFEEPEPVDIPQETREDEATPPADQPEPWPYSFYLWKLRPKHLRLDYRSTMQRWQDAVAAECQRQRVHVRFAVGLTSEGRAQNTRFLTMSVDGITVVFISADHTDDIEDIAPHAAHRLTHLRD